MNMNQLVLDLRWDVEEDGELVVYILNEETGQELSHLNINEENLLPEFFNDLTEFEATGDDSILADWESLAENLSEIAERIEESVALSKKAHKDFRLNLLSKGLNV